MSCPINSAPCDGTNGNTTIYGFPGYSAGLGYDNCTGWGSMNGQGFAEVLLSTPTKSGKTPAKFAGLAATADSSTTAKVSWNASGRATGYLIEATAPTNPIPLAFVSKGTTTEITNLVPKTTYEVHVFALNRSGSTQSPTATSLTTP